MWWSPLFAFSIALDPNDLAGDDTNFVEVASTRKCRIALDSIARRYARPSILHVLT